MAHLGQVLVPGLLLLAWVGWWLFAVNWIVAWDWLRRGAWVGVVLLAVMAALAWSQIAPSNLSLGFAAAPNFWWQLAATAVLVGLAFFSGWLQGVIGWMPANISIYPAEATHDDTHGHEHPVGALHSHDRFHEDKPQTEANGHGGHH